MNQNVAPVNKVSANDQMLEVWHLVSLGQSGEDGKSNWTRDMRLGPKYVRGRDLASFFRRHPEYNSGKAEWKETNLRVSESEIFSEIPIELEM